MNGVCLVTSTPGLVGLLGVQVDTAYHTLPSLTTITERERGGGGSFGRRHEIIEILK